MKNNIALSNQPPRKRLRRSDTDSLQCVACIRLFSKSSLPKLNSKTGLAHQTRNSCKASIRNGCVLCSLILRIATEQFGHRWASHKPIVFHNSSPIRGHESPIYTLRGTLGSVDGSINLYPFVEQDDPLGALVSRRPISRDVSSPRVINAAKELLNSCRSPVKPSEGHEECRYSRDTVLPTRVLQVGTNKGVACPIQLHINDRDRCGDYLALSYCWGHEQTSATKTKLVQLEHANQKDLEKEIKMESFERTIQDAVIITRKLGFNYLWVDRFCILQDDDEDKKQEFSRMAITYKNAVITLVAGTATAASEGFLRINSSNRKPFLPSRKVKISTEEGQTGVVYFPDKPYQPAHPIDTRGWTLQEFMLSSRMLIFSDYQLLWQCKQVDLQSVTGDDEGLEYQQGIESLPWAAFEDTDGPSFGADDIDKLYLWKTILRQYTERDLTNPADRLPAITGIIAELQNVWKDTAIYGHWVKWFIQLLAWHKPPDDRVKERHLTRAPSWSWVSINGRIHFEGMIEDDAKMEIVTAGKVTMSCRTVLGDTIDEDVLETMDRHFDLEKMARRLETKDKTCHYILLGTTKESDGFENAIALIAIESRHGVYRRIGLAVVADTSIWMNTKHQVIELEAKQK